VRELVRTAKIVGLGQLRRLNQAHRVGWMGILSGFYTARTIEALFNVGFFDEVQAKGSVDPDAFARGKGLDASILRSLCDSLFALRVLRKNGKGYALDRKGEVVVEMARGWFDISYGYEDVFHNLEALLRGEKRYGRDVHRRSVWVAAGSGEIERLVYFPLAIEMARARGARRVLDLGCGDGTFLRDLCQKAPEVTGYGLDLAPDAIEDGKVKAQAAGLGDRIHLLAEDICQVAQLPESWRHVDVAFTFFVLHELRYIGVDCVVEFLRAFRKLFPKVPLVVFEAIRPTLEAMRKRPGMSVHYFLYHDLTHQKPVGRDEWRTLFQDAGFTTIEERWLGFAQTSIFTCL
jgi:SAM-dependent methyltransferase